jgi:CHASE3 domain sensor protein
MASKGKAVNRLEIVFAGIGLSILLGTILLSYRDWKEFRQASAETEHTRKVLETTEALISDLKDAETGQRGFLLSGDKRYLEPYENALAVIPDRLQRLTALTAAEPTQADRVKLLGSLTSQKLASGKVKGATPSSCE